MSDTPENIYKVVFLNQGQIYEVYAHNIYQSDLWASSRLKTTSSARDHRW